MGLGEDVDHVSEFVSSWRPAVIECALGGVYQTCCILSMCTVLIVYAMCSISLSYEIGAGGKIADEAQPALFILGVSLMAMAGGKYVGLLVSDERYVAMIGHERRLSELIGWSE
jgi:hypothetical protein